MSYYNTKQALIKRLINTSIPNITQDDIAFENKDFNPAGKSLWLACYFLPASTEILGKTSQSGDEQRGVFQVSVFVALNSKEYDNVQLQTVDAVLSAFQYNASEVYNDQVVDILSSTVNSGSENESYFKRDLSINYLTFSKRV